VRIDAEALKIMLADLFIENRVLSMEIDRLKVENEELKRCAFLPGDCPQSKGESK
jgi:hypothetical protein